jgi:hypothetical protein
MRFVLVKERSPRRQAFCVSCDGPIRAGYLREIGTRLTYCNHDCYEDHCQSALSVLESQARVSRAASPSVRRAHEQEGLTDGSRLNDQSGHRR